MLLSENAYGYAKRLRFIKGVIENYSPKSVLDIGCGIGTYVTSPLAECFPDVKFVGTDTDVPSVMSTI